MKVRTTVSVLALSAFAFGGALAEDHDLTTRLVYGDAQTKKDSGTDFYDSAFKSKGESSGTSQELKPGKWQEEDVSKIFPELRVLDDFSSRKSLKQLQKVLNYYNYATSRMRAAEADIKIKKLEWAGEQHRYPWMELDRKKQQQRVIDRIEARQRNKAIGDLVRAMQTMESIRNPTVVESPQFVDLKSKVMVEYVKLQFRSHNLGLCIPVLEQYLALKPEHSKDPEPHRLLAASYRHQENIAKRMRNYEAELAYRRQKNEHLEKFVLLKYGKESAQYEQIATQIKRDMIGAR